MAEESETPVTPSSEPQAKTLAEFFGVDVVDFGPNINERVKSETAHVIIDVQREFCDPTHERNRGNKETDRISGVIADSIAPKFREAGMPTFLIYYTDDIKNGDADTACGGFHKIKPEDGDELVAKNTDSAFHSGNFRELLEERGIKNLIVSGFNANSCVKRTVYSAKEEGINVCILKDGVGNDNCNKLDTLSETFAMMKEKGIVVANSDTVLGHLKAAGASKKALPART